MTSIIRDCYGERDKAEQNDSSEEAKEKRRKLNRGKP
jgi:hypothetical protein